MKRIDVFLENPVDFKYAFERRKIIKIESIEIYLADIDDIIRMKEKTKRHIDKEDVEKLKIIKRECR